MPHNIIVTFECPVCRQVSEASLGKALRIDTTERYVGAGEYVGELERVGLYCTGCKETSDLEMYDE